MEIGLSGVACRRLVRGDIGSTTALNRASPEQPSQANLARAKQNMLSTGMRGC